MKTIKTFEDYLMAICPCHTNNGPEGYEKWLENRDIEEMIEYAENYGEYCKNIGATEAFNSVSQLTKEEVI